jgi:60 kDa SS-A/Ro ribonucleoprotein
MRDPLARVAALATPQSQPLRGRAQVQNAAGGYVFEKSAWTKLEDFLILGTAGGTYYTTEDTLTTTNVDWLIDAIAEDGPRVVALVTDISTARPPRAPKPRACLFALAAAAAIGDAETKQAVKAVFPRVVRTTDHLAQFFGYWKNLAGKPVAGRGTSPVIGRAMRSAFASWFDAGDVHDVAFRALKARQRVTPSGENMALRDIIRIAHPAGRTDQHRALIGWLAGRVDDEHARELLPDLDSFLAAQAVTTPREAVEVIRQRRVPWEFLPSAVLSDKTVWDELAATIGLTALIRNLARMTRIGSIVPFGPTTDLVVRRITSPDGLAGARIHPMDAYLALKVYGSGRSQPAPRKPANTWIPVGAVTDALEAAYEVSFGTVEPSGRRLLVAVDSSGSMTHGVVTAGGSPLGRAYEVANAMAAMLARIDGKNVHVIDVDTTVHRSKVTAATNLRELANWRPSGGGTDMGASLRWARQQSLAVDGVVILTDNETWAGRSHPDEELAAYRQTVNPDVRVIVVSMTAAGYGIADPASENVLQVAGLDASLPMLIGGFVR